MVKRVISCGIVLLLVMAIALSINFNPDVRAHDINTDSGVSIRHVHPGPGWTEEEKEAIRAGTKANYPDAEAVGDPTKEYNCHGLTFDDGDSWVDCPSVDEILDRITRDGLDLTLENIKKVAAQLSTEMIETIMAESGYECFDQRDPVPVELAESAKCIIVYYDNGNIIHTGLVEGYDDEGNPTTIRSKWGGHGEYRHKPDESPYGTDWKICCKAP